MDHLLCLSRWLFERRPLRSDRQDLLGQFVTGRQAPLVDKIVREGVPQFGGEPYRLDVDTLVVSVEHDAIVLEAEPRAEQSVPVRSCTGATEEPRVGGADGEERNRFRSFVERLRHAAER